MILSKICEERRFKAAALHAVLVKRLRRNLHNHIFAPGAEHTGKNHMKLRRIRRCVFCRQSNVSDKVLYRSDKPDFFAVCLKNMLYQICYCGFSVCTGNADKLHFLCRPAVYVCAHNSVCRSGIRHQHLLLNSGIAFRNNPRSSAAFCRTGIFVTVACAAFYTDKHGTRFHLAGIAGYIFYFHILYCTGIFNIP